MTPAVVLDPVIAARALAQSGPVVIGLGDLDLTCPTCRGTQRRSTIGPTGKMRCNECTSGQVSPVSGLHTLATTDGWLQGTCRLDFLPVVGEDGALFDRFSPDRYIEVRPSGTINDGIWWEDVEGHWVDPDSEHYEPLDISGAPGLFKPGGWAAVLTEWDPTIPCPACRDRPGVRSDLDHTFAPPGGMPKGGFLGPSSTPCERCDDSLDEHYCRRCDGDGWTSGPVSWSSAPDLPTYLPNGTNLNGATT